MDRQTRFFGAMAAGAALTLVVACSAAPAAAPTSAPVAAPTLAKAAPPTAAPAAQPPTAAPAAAPTPAATTAPAAPPTAVPAASVAPVVAASPAVVSSAPVNTASLGLIQAGTITAATQDAQKGFTQVNASGQREGFAIDILNEAAKRMNLKTTYTAMSLQALLPAVGTDQYDIGAVGLAVTDARKPTVDFSQPYYYGFAGLLVRKAASFNSLDDLAGKDVAAITATVQEQTLKTDYPKVNLKSFDSQPNALAALRGGQVDAFLVGGADAEDYAKTDATLQVTQTLPSSNPTAFPIAKGKTALVSAINDQLNAMFKDGTYKTLYSKWFSGPILKQMLDLFPVLNGQ